MNIRELKAAIADLPDDMEVVSSVYDSGFDHLYKADGGVLDAFSSSDGNTTQYHFDDMNFKGLLKVKVFHVN
jgi:hypothetical protein